MSGRANRTDAAARHWLSLSEQDLAGAEALGASAAVEPRLSAGLAAQAAEKALKGAIAARGAAPPRTHDLVRLAQLARAAVDLTASDDGLRRLTDAYQQARYPDPAGSDYDRAESSELLQIARAVVGDVRNALGRR
jgi:HEPN domain-containing protein